MSDWTSGYVTDIGYTYGYYGQLNPSRLKLAFANAGIVAPEVVTACELGFGQGMNTNFHAAASSARWFGTDFNPSQAAFAMELAAASKADLHLFDQSFAEFCNRDDLPDFDFVVLHGIWSWISDDNRRAITEFLRRKLKVGGVLYISYNTQPGWASMVPMRRLLTEHSNVLAAPGTGIIPRIDAALTFGEKLLRIGSKFAKVNPVVLERLELMKKQNRLYLAHEFFNRDWCPMHFSDMAHWLNSAKMTFACSANLLDHVDIIQLTSEQQTFLAEIPDLNFRQTVRDFITNQQFRMDYWVKGARPLNRWTRSELIRSLRLVLTTPRQQVAFKVAGALGEAELKASLYSSLLEVLGDFKPKTIGQIEQLLTNQGINLDQIVQAALVLISKSNLAIASDDKTIGKARPQIDRLNQHIMKLSYGSGDVNYLGSPVTGGAVRLDRVPQLALLAMKDGKRTPREWAEFAWNVLKAEQFQVMKGDAPISGDENTVAEICAQYMEFQEHTVPMLKGLQVI